MSGDGRIGPWQIFNNMDARCFLPGTFFAARVSVPGRLPRAKVLVKDGIEGLPGISNIQTTAFFPSLFLRYIEPSWPVTIACEASSPFSPLNERDSSFPVAQFEFTITNKSDADCEVDLLASLQNGVGNDGLRPTSGVINPGYGGNVNSIHREDGHTFIQMTAHEGKPPRISRPLRIILLWSHYDLAFSEQSLFLWGVKDLAYDYTLDPRYLMETGIALGQRADVFWIDKIYPDSKMLLEKAHPFMTMFRQGGLQTAVEKGAGLLITGGKGNYLSCMSEAISTGEIGERGAAQRLMRELLPFSYEEMVSNALKNSSVVATEDSHPVFRNIDVRKIRVETVSRFKKWSLSPNSRVLISMEDGTPVLLERRVGKGRVLVYNTEFVGNGCGGTSWEGQETFLRNCIAYLGKAHYVPKEDMPADSPGAGDMVLACNDPTASVLKAWDNKATFWRTFEKKGVFNDRRKMEASPRERTWNAALSTRLILPPRGRETRTFSIAWYFPNRYAESTFGRYKPGAPIVGNFYCTRWHHARSALSDVLKNPRIMAATRRFQVALKDSSLPLWLMELISSTFSILKSPTVTWIADGRFGLWEGSGSVCGSCGISTSHVLYYAHMLGQLFPRLEQKITGMTTRHLIDSDGRVWDRIRGWDECRCDYLTLDSTPAFLLKAARDYQWTGDKRHLLSLWPALNKVLSYLIARDKDNDGLPEHDKYDMTTFDFWKIEGNTSFVSSMTITAYAAMRYLAEEVGDAGLARNMRARSAKAAKSFEAKLWRNNYYKCIHPVDNERRSPAEDICLSNQLTGMYYARLLGMKPALDKERIISALRTIYRSNFRPEYDDLYYTKGKSDGLVNASIPDAKRGYEFEREGCGALTWGYGPLMWSGIEMEVAAHMICEGLVAEGLKIAQAVYQRYDGKRANPFNHVECGNYYTRSMSSWGIMIAVSGYELNVPEGSLCFLPKICREDFKIPFLAYFGWGIFSQKKGAHSLKVSITMEEGFFRLKKLGVQGNFQDDAITVKAISRGGNLSLSYRSDREKNCLWIILGKECSLIKETVLEILVEEK